MGWGTSDGWLGGWEHNLCFSTFLLGRADSSDEWYHGHSDTLLCQLLVYVGD